MCYVDILIGYIRVGVRMYVDIFSENVSTLTLPLAYLSNNAFLSTVKWFFQITTVFNLDLHINLMKNGWY